MSVRIRLCLFAEKLKLCLLIGSLLFLSLLSCCLAQLRQKQAGKVINPTGLFIANPKTYRRICIDQYPSFWVSMVFLINSSEFIG